MAESVFINKKPWEEGFDRMTFTWGDRAIVNELRSFIEQVEKEAYERGYKDGYNWSEAVDNAQAPR